MNVFANMESILVEISNFSLHYTSNKHTHTHTGDASVALLSKA